MTDDHPEGAVDTRQFPLKEDAAEEMERKITAAYTAIIRYKVHQSFFCSDDDARTGKTRPEVVHAETIDLSRLYGIDVTYLCTLVRENWGLKTPDTAPAGTVCTSRTQWLADMGLFNPKFPPLRDVPTEFGVFCETAIKSATLTVQVMMDIFLYYGYDPKRTPDHAFLWSKVRGSLFVVFRLAYMADVADGLWKYLTQNLNNWIGALDFKDPHGRLPLAKPKDWFKDGTREKTLHPVWGNSDQPLVQWINAQRRISIRHEQNIGEETVASFAEATKVTSLAHAFLQAKAGMPLLSTARGTQASYLDHAKSMAEQPKVPNPESLKRAGVQVARRVREIFSKLRRSTLFIEFCRRNRRDPEEKASLAEFWGETSNPLPSSSAYYMAGRAEGGGLGDLIPPDVPAIERLILRTKESGTIKTRNVPVPRPQEPTCEELGQREVLSWFAHQQSVILDGDLAPVGAALSRVFRRSRAEESREDDVGEPSASIPVLPPSCVSQWEVRHHVDYLSHDDDASTLALVVLRNCDPLLPIPRPFRLLEAVPVAIAEPGKYRTITKSESPAYLVGQILQRIVVQLMRPFAYIDGDNRIRNFQTFAFTQGPPEVSIMASQFAPWLASDPDNRIWSGDYAAATDKQHWSLSLAAILAISDEMGWSDRVTVEATRLLIGHSFVYTKPSRETDKPTQAFVDQVNGQLMGSPLSFPVLCIVNAAVSAMSWEEGMSKVHGKRFRRELDRIPVLVNGDDVILGVNEDILERCAINCPSAGYTLSPGKNWIGKDFVVIDSTPFGYSTNPIIQECHAVDGVHTEFFQIGFFDSKPLRTFAPPPGLITKFQERIPATLNANFKQFVKSAGAYLPEFISSFWKNYVGVIGRCPVDVRLPTWALGKGMLCPDTSNRYLARYRKEEIKAIPYPTLALVGHVADGYERGTFNPPRDPLFPSVVRDAFAGYTDGVESAIFRRLYKQALAGFESHDQAVLAASLHISEEIMDALQFPKPVDTVMWSASQSGYLEWREQFIAHDFCEESVAAEALEAGIEPPPENSELWYADEICQIVKALQADVLSYSRRLVAATGFCAREFRMLDPLFVQILNNVVESTFFPQHPEAICTLEELEARDSLRSQLSEAHRENGLARLADDERETEERLKAFMDKQRDEIARLPEAELRKKAYFGRLHLEECRRPTPFYMIGEVRACEDRWRRFKEKTATPLGTFLPVNFLRGGGVKSDYRRTAPAGITGLWTLPVHPSDEDPRRYEVPQRFVHGGHSFWVETPFLMYNEFFRRTKKGKRTVTGGEAGAIQYATTRRPSNSAHAHALILHNKIVPLLRLCLIRWRQHTPITGDPRIFRVADFDRFQAVIAKLDGTCQFDGVPAVAEKRVEVLLRNLLVDQSGELPSLADWQVLLGGPADYAADDEAVESLPGDSRE